MTSIRLLLALAAAALVAASPASQAQTVQAASARPEAATAAVPVKDWDFYLDLPTRFVFLRTPEGWIFVGQFDELQVKGLPAGTLTTLLPPEPPVVAGRAADAADPQPR